MKIYRLIMMPDDYGHIDCFDYMEGLRKAKYFKNKEMAKQIIGDKQNSPYWYIELTELELE